MQGAIRGGNAAQSAQAAKRGEAWCGGASVRAPGERRCCPGGAKLGSMVWCPCAESSCLALSKRGLEQAAQGGMKGACARA